MGRKLGVRDEQLRELQRSDESPAFDATEKLVLRYASAMTKTPVDVPDGLFAELRRQFDARQLVELTSAIAWENYRARFDHAFGVDAAGFSEGAACALAAPPAHASAGEPR